MRFIMTCMVIVGLCLLALPLIPAVNGIQQERQQILANVAGNVNIATPPPVADDSSLLAQDANALSEIAPAAGDEFFAPGDDFTGGFSGEAPAALQDEQADPFAGTPFEQQAQ